MIYFNKEKLRDKIYACWLGKNIGGTMGTPFEGKRELLDIQGFNSPEGSALPNDDLDLQLIWLRAMDEVGPDGINSKVLGEYWTAFVGPHWNEYGICKGNMHEGILAPLSGNMNNEAWMHSNGAWIRTEIWACTNPACVEKAIRFAFEDASVDHGFGEGSYAAIFVAAMESAAFIINDINVLIDIGLSKIPEDCRVAKLVNLVRKAYADGIDWKTTRQMILEANDLGWFQAPANIAFVVLGLLYGQCDFKKSMILAINCGDDTDCTGATVGSMLGIMYGTKAIPSDWRSYIGDGIVSVAIVKGHGYWPKSCEELTDYVMHMIPATTRSHLAEYCQKNQGIVVHDGEDDFGDIDVSSFYGKDFVNRLFSRSQYSFTMEGVFATVLVEYEKEPYITANGALQCKISILPNFNDISHDHYELKWYLPEGWCADGRKNIFISPLSYPRTELGSTEFTIIAGENVSANNRLVLEVTCNGHAMPIYVPVVIFG